MVFSIGKYKDKVLWCAQACGSFTVGEALAI